MGEARGGTERGPSVRGAVSRFMIAGLVALAALAVAGFVVLRPIGEEEAVDDARRLATLAGRGVVEPALTDAPSTATRRRSSASTGSCRSGCSARTLCGSRSGPPTAGSHTPTSRG